MQVDRDLQTKELILLRDWLISSFKLAIVLGLVGVVGVGIYVGYQYAFPPTAQSAKINLPNLDLTSCSSAAGGFDPADLVYAYQLQQQQEKLTRPASNDGSDATFTIDAGELPSEIAARLQHDGFVSDGDVFVTLLKCRHASEKIQAGDHVLRRNMTMDQIVQALEKGTQRGTTFTITPGWRAEQIADYLSTLSLTQFDKNEFLKLVKAGDYDYAYLKDRPKSSSTSVEGFLYPETYNVLPEITADQLINRTLAEFDQRIGPDLRQQATTEGLTMSEVITLASIVEREAVRKEEAPIIASVYLNRLKKKMLLNADPTVQYALGHQPDARQWWPVVTIDMYSKVDSPYNTYLYAGLPPGPICEPGQNAILAALNAAQTDYLYFLAKGDGSHVFARTLEEQTANMAKYGYAPVPTPKSQK